jgi:RNA recognition motif-containing protein
MSAIKHMNAKSVHIPKNGKTGKRRNFAIIGFQDYNDLNKAVTSHVELFGCNTWWSAKNISKTTRTDTRTKKSTTNFYSTKDSQSNTTQFLHEREKPLVIQSENFSNNRKALKERKTKTISSTSQSSLSQHNNSDWNRMTSLLERIENRLNKLEEKETIKIRDRLNACNHS